MYNVNKKFIWDTLAFATEKKKIRKQFETKKWDITNQINSLNEVYHLNFCYKKSIFPSLFINHTF